MEQKLIDEVKEKLNNAIKNEEDFETIYSISLELDKLIAEYYLKKENTIYGT